MENLELADDLQAWLDDMNLKDIFELYHMVKDCEELPETHLLPVFAKQLPLDTVKEKVNDCWASWQ